MKYINDFRAISLSFKALKRSTNSRTLLANIDYLVDRFLRHPSRDIPRRLRQKKVQP